MHSLILCAILERTESKQRGRLENLVAPILYPTTKIRSKISSEVTNRRLSFKYSQKAVRNYEKKEKHSWIYRANQI